MKRASYRDSCWWIALNDDNGSPDAQDVEVVASYISTSLVADQFDVPRERVAADVVRYRKQQALGEKLAARQDKFKAGV